MSTPWPENPKFCKDCKWYSGAWARCNCPSCFYLCLITGDKHKVDAFDARKDTGICGIEARYFEPKE